MKGSSTQIKPAHSWMSSRIVLSLWVSTWGCGSAVNTPAINFGTGYQASNICSGTTIYGLAGTAGCPASNACRDAGVLPSFMGGTTSLQLSQSAEVSLYGQSASGGASLPTTGGYSYREVPTDKDDDGFSGMSVVYALRPTVACGSSGTIAERILNCATANPSRSTWDGSVKGNAGQGVWKLVYATGQTTLNSCSGAGTDCKEVWQDQRTGLLWSSLANNQAQVRWCQAAGSTSLAPVTLKNVYNNAGGTPIGGNGTISNITGGSLSVTENPIVQFTSATTFTVSGANCGGGGPLVIGAEAGSTVTYTKTNYCSFTLTQGTTPFANLDTFYLDSRPAATLSCVPGVVALNQPTNAVSYCAEISGMYPGFTSGAWGSGDSFTSGWAVGNTYTYDQAKGGMGATSTHPVHWRLPTQYDYKMADINGIRFVMPDAGSPNATRPIPDGSPGSATAEWTSTLEANARANAWLFNATFGHVNFNARTSTFVVRCVGR